jgi:predicted phosphodiesterase
MKILHLSDIHLSKDNYKELENNYFDELIKYMQKEKHKIDLVIITGDLVDRGGLSLIEIPKNVKKHINPFFIFEELFLNPLKNILNISNKDIVFVPGNHDVDESEMLWVDEKELKTKTNKEIENIVDADELNRFNKRIENFKEFEKEYHKDTEDYKPTNFHSTYIYKYQASNSQFEHKIGFLLLNDSWRCSTCNIENSKTHYFGINQFHNGYNLLKKHKTNFNIALFHHPFDKLEESKDLQELLRVKDISFFLLGDIHEKADYNIINSIGNCIGFGCRKSKPVFDENIIYSNGFQIFDIDLVKNKIDNVHYVIYYGNRGFQPDSYNAKNGDGTYPIQYSFSNSKTNFKIDKDALIS